MSQALSILNDLEDDDIAWLSTHGCHLDFSAGEAASERIRESASHSDHQFRTMIAVLDGRR